MSEEDGRLFDVKRLRLLCFRRRFGVKNAKVNFHFAISILLDIDGVRLF